MSVFLKKTITFTLIFVAFFSIAFVVSGQSSVSTSLASLNLDISPNSPRAGDSVTLTLSSDLLDLDSSRIIWYIDDTALKGTASKSITIKAKSNGDITTIRAVVETADGITKEITGEISPGGVDLFTEPVAYSMPFYKGKPFFASQGSFRMVAIPDIMIDGEKIPSSKLIFKWSKDGSILGSNSGKGMDSLIVNGTIPSRDINIGVQILDNANNVLASNSKLVTLNNPKLLFYEDSPLYGVLYNKAIVGNYYLGTREELNIIAKPFSFSFSSDAPSEANYVWTSNGNYVSPNGRENELILRQTTTNLVGTASISVDLKNNKKINQFITGGFSIQFGQ